MTRAVVCFSAQEPRGGLQGWVKERRSWFSMHHSTCSALPSTICPLRDPPAEGHLTNHTLHCRRRRHLVVFFPAGHVTRRCGSLCPAPTSGQTGSNRPRPTDARLPPGGRPLPDSPTLPTFLFRLVARRALQQLSTLLFEPVPAAEASQCGAPAFSVVFIVSHLHHYAHFKH